MKWRDGRRSRQVEDRRQSSTPRASSSNAVLLRVLPLLLKKKSGKLVFVLILGLVIASHFGVDLGNLTGDPSVRSPHQAGTYPPSAEDKELADFVSVVLADTEDSWHAMFTAINRRYEEPTLVLFSNGVRSACGLASAAMGPFYCPADRKVYIDLSFYRDLKNRHGAPGDFAQAYVIAHEVGHHVQTLLGISSQVRQAQQKVSKTEANRLSVRLELQADCFAGLWAHQADRMRSLLETGDLEEALTAAAAIGDDRLQRQATGAVVPERFTHGTSKQRVNWFRRGFDSGKLEACDTFQENT